MKKILSSVLLATLFVGSSVLASSSSKVCFGSTKDPETKGLVMIAQIDKQKIGLKTIKGDYYYKGGTYPAYNKSVKGRDGRIYLEYKGESGDYQDVILVDQALLLNATTGLLQIRARGEGFFNAVFVCKDAR